MPGLSLLLALAAASAPPTSALPIGRVLWKGRGTGFLVGPCTMMTSKHVGPRGRARAGARVDVRIQRERTRGTVVALGDSKDVWDPDTHWQGDWALIHLDRCLGERMGYFRLLAEPFWSTAQFRRQGPEPRTTGFPFGSSSAVHSGPCPARAVQSDGTIVLSCEIRPGQSGSPLFIRTSGGELLALGIVSGAVRGMPLSYAAEVGTAAALLARPPSEREP